MDEKLREKLGLGGFPDAKIPIPTGWRVLVKDWEPPKKTVSGIYIPEQSQSDISHFTNIAQVVALGPGAYRHQKFLIVDGKNLSLQSPWCQPGDWVSVRSFEGQKIKVEDGEQTITFRLVNDESILSVHATRKGLTVGGIDE